MHRLVFAGAPSGAEDLAVTEEPRTGAGKRRFLGYEGFAPAKCAKRDPSTTRRVATALLPPFLRSDYLLHPLRALGLDAARKDVLCESGAVFPVQGLVCFGKSPFSGL